MFQYLYSCVCAKRCVRVYSEYMYIELYNLYPHHHHQHQHRHCCLFRFYNVCARERDISEEFCLLHPLSHPLVRASPRLILAIALSTYLYLYTLTAAAAAAAAQNTTEHTLI